MRRITSLLSSGRLLFVLIASFSFVAALTVIVGAVAFSRLISDYLGRAEAERVARDMGLAQALYQLRLEDIEAVNYRLANEPWVVENISAAQQGKQAELDMLTAEIGRQVNDPTCNCTNLSLIMDRDGNIISGWILSSEAEEHIPSNTGNWGELPIVKSGLVSKSSRSATEIIPVEFLRQIGLERQAQVDLIPTDRAANMPFDSREGTAGLALTNVYPILDESLEIVGIVLSAYLINNDFTFVDLIKDIAKIDTVTIFFGDLRVSTNVYNEDRTRAVGTRVSKEVFDVVLIQEQPYVGRAYVVNDWYITRYDPLRDHNGQVVGSLYVGARVSDFELLVQSFNLRVGLIAFICIVLAGIIAGPIARLITQPISRLVDANQRLASGDLSVRVPVEGNGELAVLERSFNNMAETVQKTQRELLHKEKLASMGQLAAGVAHEINNPLTSILLFANMMYQEAFENDPRREDLKLIITETTRCKTIVAGLLNFARQQEVIAQETNLEDLLEQTIKNVILLPTYENVLINREYTADLPIIQADPAQLQQVFANLLNNAVDAMERSGTITIKTGITDSKKVEIRITDTGCGIPQESINNLFTPFFTTKGAGKGTGLGLSIVYGIIKMHRGQIWVESKIGNGSTFVVTLPIEHPESQLDTNCLSEGLIG